MQRLSHLGLYLLDLFNDPHRAPAAAPLPAPERVCCWVMRVIKTSSDCLEQVGWGYMLALQTL
jgi:hypothetical protein